MSDPVFTVAYEFGELVLTVYAQAREGKQGAKCWIARIAGPNPKFKFERKFLGKQRIGPEGFSESAVPTSELQDGDILEISSGGIWAWQMRGFYQYFGGTDLRKMTVEQVAEAVGAPHQRKLPAEPTSARRTFRLEEDDDGHKGNAD